MAVDTDMLDFDSITPESLKAEAKEKIRATLEAQEMEIDLREGSYTDVLLSEGAMQVYKAYMLAQDLVAVAVPTADGGRRLDAFGGIFGIARTAGTRAEVEVTFSGENGVTVPAGTWICAGTGERFETLENAVIARGSATVRARAEEEGSAYNVDAGEIVRLQSSLVGVSAVSNAAAAAGGADQESDAAYYGRIHTLLSQPVASGNANNYKQWALEVAGVGYAAVQPLWNGAGTVRVIIAGPDLGAVSGETKTAVETHIEEERPIGAAVTVTNVEPVTINVVATVTLSGTNTAQVQKDLRAALDALFSTWEIGTAGCVRYRRVMALLMNVDGVVDYSVLKVNGGTSDVELTTVQVPNCGTITITEG